MPLILNKSIRTCIHTYIHSRVEGTVLSYRGIILITKCRKTEKNRKSLEHHSINCWKQDPPMDAKICGQKFKLKQDVHIASMYFSQNIY